LAQYELLTLFADGGWMMYPLVLCSLVALGVIIAKAWTLWVAHKGTQELLSQVEEAARRGDMAGAMEIAFETPGPTAAILMAGLRRIRQGTVRKGEVDQAVNTTGTIELGFLERGLVILATIANVAPLMGFLGTVAGMILAFDAIADAGDVDPSLVAGGIKVALLTTAAGLVIAVPVNIGYNFFVTRIDSLILDMEQGAQRILSLAWDFEKDGTLNVVEERVRVQPLPARRPRSAPQSSPPPSSDDGEGAEGPPAGG
jgi:biopolymer transport protein ExbB